MSNKASKNGIRANIQNIVASVDLKCRINVDRVIVKFPPYVFVSYIPGQFPGAVVKIKDPVKVSTLVFSSGKLVVTGAKSTEVIEEAVDFISNLLKDAGTKIRHQPVITVQNIVASGSLGQKIDLELAALLLENSMYEPEQFPGLIYRMSEPKVVLLLFQSGNLVCTGAKKEEYVYQSINIIFNILEEIDAFEIQVMVDPV